MFERLVINYGHFLFRYRNILFPVILLILIFLFPPHPLGDNTHLDIWMDIAGILVIISGQVIRASVIGLAYIKRGGVNKKIHADTLVKDGIFAHCRNPLYVGNLMILLGFLVIQNNIWVYILGCSFFLFSYFSIVKAEESFLQDKFGDEFNQYCKKVNRWLISFSGMSKTLGSMHFNWRRVIAKDYTTMLTWFLTVMTLLVLERIRFYGPELSRTFLVYIIPPILFALIMTVIVRILKKNGRLSS